MRRDFARSGLTILAAFAVLIAGQTTPASGQDFVPANSARAFGDSLGVNVRLTYIDTPAYRDFAPLEYRLHDLGVRYVSDSLCPTCEYQIDRLQRLAASGIRANLGVASLAEGPSAIAPRLQVLRTRLRSSVASIATVNEPDISGDPDWVAHTRAIQIELHRQAKGDPFLAQFPLIGPALVNRESRAALGDLSAYLDRGNLHPYPGGTPPLGSLVDEQQMMSAVSGSKPLQITEVGYHTDLGAPGPHRPASEAAVAIYTPRIALEAFRFGIERTYYYTLADVWSPEEATRYGISAAENSFGLLRWDLSPKPSFYALRNLLRAVDGDSAPVAVPGGMRLTVEGAGPDVRQLLLQSADGSYALVLWRDVSVWDRTALQDLSPAPDHVDVKLGQPVALARRFDPVASDMESQRWNNPQQIPLDLTGTPVVLRLVPPGAVARARGGKRKRRCAAAAIADGSAQTSRRKARPRCCRAARHKHARKAKRRHPRHARHAGGHRARASWTSGCVSTGRPRR